LILASSNGLLVAVASHNLVYVYYTNNYTLYETLSCSSKNSVSALAYDDKRKYLIVGDASGEIYYWNVTANNCTNIDFRAHELGVSTLKYLGNDQFLSSEH